MDKLLSTAKDFLQDDNADKKQQQRMLVLVLLCDP